MMVMGDDTSRECFGLPHGGAMAVVAFGMGINLMAFIMILFGTLVVARAIYTLTRERR